MKLIHIFRNSLLILVLVALALVAMTQTPANSSAIEKSSGYAAVNGLKMYYEVHGEGDPIVLLHGAYMSIDMNWSEVIPELAKTRRVIVLEMQGHGRTADIDRPFSYPALAGDVAGLMNVLKIESADILGYSFGGTVAFQLAVDHPEMVKNLIIISSVYRYDGWLPEVRDILKSFKPEFFDNTPLKPEYERLAPDPKHWRAFLTKFMEFDTKDFAIADEKIQAIKSPVLIISGDNDGVDLNHISRTYKLLGGGVAGDIAGMPKSQLAILPASNHVGLMMQTSKILEILYGFLNPAPQAAHH